MTLAVRFGAGHSRTGTFACSGPDLSSPGHGVLTMQSHRLVVLVAALVASASASAVAQDQPKQPPAEPGIPPAKPPKDAGKGTRIKMGGDGDPPPAEQPKEGDKPTAPKTPEKTEPELWMEALAQWPSAEAKQ